MSKVSEFLTVDHEPFNANRAWGPVAAAFRRTGDIEELRTSIEGLLLERPNIKHCIEMVPLELTRELIGRCVANGYVFFVLTRRNEVDRLMSLMLANATGVWGRSDAEVVYPKIRSGDIHVPALSTEDATRQARRDSIYLGTTLKILRHRAVAYEWLIFEEVYKGSQPVAEHACRIARLLGSGIESGDQRLLGLGEGAPQNSWQIEELVENAREVRKHLEKLCLE